jgi:D-fructose 1,6-bisphosphatase (EC 3.1.3.11)
MFKDKAYDYARKVASDIANILRRQGIFEPHRLPSEEMEYTTLPKVIEKLSSRFFDVDTNVSSDKSNMLAKEDMD